jgi:hypothetical protein
MNNFRKYLLISLVFASLNAALLLIFFIPRIHHADTREYVATIQYIAGSPEGELFPHRILKPLPLMIGSLFTPIMSPQNALIFQNLIFYFLSAWLIFVLIFRLYKNEKQAFYGTILYVTAYPMLAYGLAALTDISGWFFYLLSAIIALNIFNKPQLKTAFWAGFAAGAGMLFKENTAAAPIFFASLLFIAVNLPFKEKLKYILIYGTAFIFPVLISGIVIYRIYSYSYLDWYKAIWEHSTTGLYAYSPFRILIEGGRVLLIGWIFVLIGALKEFFLKNIERIKVLISFIPPSLSFFLWAFPHNRIIYIAFPLLVILGSLGLLKNFKNPKINTFTEIFLLSSYVLVNYFVLDFLLRYGSIIQPPGTTFG